MHFQQSLARAAITALQLLVTEPEIPSAAYMYIYSFAVVAQEIKLARYTTGTANLEGVVCR